jgi:hypothetical protein
MTTDGSNHLDNIHPYKVLSIDDGDSIDLYMMHNGIISECRPAISYVGGKSFQNSYNWKGSYLDADYIDADDDTSVKNGGIQERVQPSDTQIFINEYLKPLLKQTPELLYTQSLQKLIKGFIGTGNKLIFLDSNSKVTIINENQGTQLPETQGGCWISNTYSHLPRIVYTYSNTNNTTNNSTIPIKSSYTPPAKSTAPIINHYYKNGDAVDRYYGYDDYDDNEDYGYTDEFLSKHTSPYNSKPFWDNKTPEEVVDYLCMTSNFDSIGDLILNDVDMAEEVMSHLLDFYWTNNHKYSIPTTPVVTSKLRKVTTTHRKVKSNNKNISNKKVNAK